MTLPAAVVMASSRGLGSACAQELSIRGHPVALCGRDEGQVAGSAEKIRASGRQAIGMIADVSRSQDIDNLISRTEEELGRVGVLVTNAGGPPAGSFIDVDLEQWDAAYHLTLRSAIVAARRVLPGMREAGWGRIVVIGSSSVRRPIPGLSLSNIYRPALAGMVMDLAASLPDGITVNMVAPGRIDTDRVRDLDMAAAGMHGVTEAEIRQRSTAKIPAGRYGTPEEFAAVVGFLASQEAAYVTGQVILADGGMAVKG